MMKLINYIELAFQKNALYRAIAILKDNPQFL